MPDCECGCSYEAHNKYGVCKYDVGAAHACDFGYKPIESPAKEDDFIDCRFNKAL